MDSRLPSPPVLSNPASSCFVCATARRKPSRFLFYVALVPHAPQRRVHSSSPMAHGHRKTREGGLSQSLQWGPRCGLLLPHPLLTTTACQAGPTDSHIPLEPGVGACGSALCPGEAKASKVANFTKAGEGRQASIGQHSKAAAAAQPRLQPPASCCARGLLAAPACRPTGRVHVQEEQPVSPPSRRSMIGGRVSLTYLAHAKYEKIIEEKGNCVVPVR